MCGCFLGDIALADLALPQLPVAVLMQAAGCRCCQAPVRSRPRRRGRGPFHDPHPATTTLTVNRLRTLLGPEVEGLAIELFELPNLRALERCDPWPTRRRRRLLHPAGPAGEGTGGVPAQPGPRNPGRPCSTASNRPEFGQDLSDYVRERCGAAKSVAAPLADVGACGTGRTTCRQPAHETPCSQGCLGVRLLSGYRCH